MRAHGRAGSIALGLVFVLLVAGCVPVTVNISFPQEKLEKAADQIENKVRSPDNPVPAAPATPTAPSSALERGLAALGPREATAQETTVQVPPTPRIDSPEIEKAVAARRSRFRVLRERKSKGCVGENNQGLLELRPGQDCGGDVEALIRAENADRELIMAEFMRDNRIPPTDMGRVHTAFANSHRKHLRPGDWFQQDGGEWTRQ